MGAKKFYITREDVVAITCPGCGGMNRMPLEKFKAKPFGLKVKCPCGHIFAIDVICKRAYRKETKLAGSYKRPAGKGTWLDMKVLNVSKTGIAFSTPDIADIKRGDRCKVKFALNDAKRSEIESVVIVRNKDESCMGCQFVGYMPQHSKNVLDSFLTP